MKIVDWFMVENYIICNQGSKTCNQSTKNPPFSP